MKEKGLSPVFGTLVLVFILLLSMGISAFIIANGTDVDRSVQAGVDVENDVDGVTVTWKEQGNAQKIRVIAGEKQIVQLNDVSDTATIGAKQDMEVKILAVKDNTETELTSVITKTDSTQTEQNIELLRKKVATDN